MTDLFLCLFVLDTPALVGKSSNGWWRTSSTGSFCALAWFSCDRPHCVMAEAAVTGREYHYAYCRLSPYWEPPSGHSSLFSLRAARKKHHRPKKKVRSRCFYHTAHPGAVAIVAYVHHNNNRNVLDEWVCCFQGAALSIPKTNR